MAQDGRRGNRNTQLSTTCRDLALRAQPGLQYDAAGLPFWLLTGVGGGGEAGTGRGSAGAGGQGPVLRYTRDRAPQGGAGVCTAGNWVDCPAAQGTELGTGRGVPTLRCVGGRTPAHMIPTS